MVDGMKKFAALVSSNACDICDSAMTTYIGCIFSFVSLIVCNDFWYSVAFVMTVFILFQVTNR